MTDCKITIAISGLMGVQKGIFNLCSTNPVDNATFTKTLAQSLVLKLGIGKAHTMLTKGQQVLPSRLSDKGFEFKFPVIVYAVKNLVQQS